MHPIPTDQGRVIYWYVDSGCAAIDGRLYYVKDQYNDTFLNLSQAVHKGLLAHAIVWPMQHHIRIFNFQGTLDLYPSDTVSCLFVTERAYYERGLRASDPNIDTINHAFRRLQRWFRARAKHLRQERCLAVAMGLHDAIGKHSHMQSLPPELVHLILHQTNK